MDREEAIRRIKAWNLDSGDREVLAVVIPELAESEDEKTRKELLEEIESIIPHEDETDSEGLILPSYHTRIDRYKSYLEKQKYDRMQPVYDNLDSFESALAKAWKEYNDSGSRTVDGCEDDYVECAHAKGFREGYLFGFEKQKEQKPEWKPQPESLEALMYAIEGKWDMISPTSYLSRRLEDLYEGLVNTFNVDESLLAELPKVASRAYTAEDIEELRELKRKIETSMEQKPAEWSEEDEKWFDYFERLLEFGYNKDPHHLGKLCIGGKMWLKSLRNRGTNCTLLWKPSEEQMEWLESAVRLSTNKPHIHGIIISLYEQLKKL